MWDTRFESRATFLCLILFHLLLRLSFRTQSLLCSRVCKFIISSPPHRFESCNWNQTDPRRKVTWLGFWGFGRLLHPFSGHIVLRTSMCPPSSEFRSPPPAIITVILLLRGWEANFALCMPSSDRELRQSRSARCSGQMRWHLILSVKAPDCLEHTCVDHLLRGMLSYEGQLCIWRITSGWKYVQEV